MNVLLLGVSTLAQPAVDPADVKPGWVALVIVLLMGLATFLLWRSMNHQLGKVDFDEGGSPGTEGTPGDDRAVADGDGGASRP